jgi:large subunit ribosomal protein L4
MAQVDIYSWEGEKSGTMELPETLFGARVNPALVHEVVVAQEANSRVRFAQSKGRHEVRGGGRKPWRQKGTGRARHGSRRSPIWKGGGVTFGPQAARNFAKKVNKRVRRMALAMVLTDKVKHDRLLVVDAFKIEEGKTRVVGDMRKRLPGSDRPMLIVTTDKDSAIALGVRNIEKTAVIGARNLNVRDLLKYEYVLASKESMDQVLAHFSK